MPKLPNNLNTNFWNWFADSKVINADGTPRVMYHGTSQDFDTFDPTKIKVMDTDAPFNGFWFSDSPETSPAFHDPTNIMPVYLRITNPADWRVWRKVTQWVNNDYREQGELPSRSRSTNDEVRHRLSDMGYDGILFSGRPDINAEELERTGRIDFRNVRGHKAWLQKDTRPEVEWKEYSEPQSFPVGEIVRANGKREPLKMTMNAVASFITADPDNINKIDASKFDFSDLTGEIILANGDKIISNMVTKEVPTAGWRNTGKDVDEIGYYTQYIGHVTSYDNLADFIESHETVWVCFFPNQIKSIYNNGSWSNSHKITEGLRGWIDLFKNNS